MTISINKSQLPTLKQNYLNCAKDIGVFKLQDHYILVSNKENVLTPVFLVFDRYFNWGKATYDGLSML